MAQRMHLGATFPSPTHGGIDRLAACVRTTRGAARLREEKPSPMSDWSIVYDDAGMRPCSKCGLVIAALAGPRLANQGAFVCQSCGRSLAPELTALLLLGKQAESLGRVLCHRLWLPLEKQLAFARAAHDYANALERRRRS